MSVPKPRVLGVVPARGGSKGLPGKNIRKLAGLPLIAHSLACARACSAITRTIVSTDSEQIADVARAHGGDVPFLRPDDLAGDTTPMWPVLRHALAFVEAEEARPYDLLVLLDPTSPGRMPDDIRSAIDQVTATPDADGVVAVSQPEFNPLWHCVVSRNGWMEDLNPGAAQYARRQDVPPVFRINATLYVWRARFVRDEAADWRANGRHLLYEVPEARAIHIDDADEFAKAEALIGAGLIALPWLKGAGDRG